MRSNKPTVSPKARRVFLELETLEMRCLPANIFWVNSTTDLPDPTPNNAVQDDVDPITPGVQYSLRGAIQTANFTNNVPGDPDRIRFEIGNGLQIIAPATELPVITDAALIDAYAPIDKHAHLGDQKIKLLGNNQLAHGLKIGDQNNDAGGSIVQGLVIVKFQNGIVLENGSGTIIRGNYIGVDETGQIPQGNEIGILISSKATENIIGESLTNGRNIISGNTTAGITLSGIGADKNTIQNNFIGTNLDGTNAVPNWIGINIIGRDENVIGGDTTGTGNLISGNTFEGIHLTTAPDDAAPDKNIIRRNLIGTKLDGVTSLPNQRGIYIRGGSQNIIGGSLYEYGNTISGNTEDGVYLHILAQETLIQNNYIGTDVFGKNAVGNKFNGIYALSALFNVIQDNLISGNERNGISLDFVSNANVIEGNNIGTDVTGLQMIPNGTTQLKALTDKNGILVRDSSSNAIQNNLISSNIWNGIVIQNEKRFAEENTIQGNIIGMDILGTAELPNGIHGIWLDKANKNIIGGASAQTGKFPGNLISGNLGTGIRIEGDLGNGDKNKILGNMIGTDISGTIAKANKQGIEITTSYNEIGGNAAGELNVISGNAESGIAIENSLSLTAKANQILFNHIGTDLSGTKALGNGAHGIDVRNEGANVIANNVISGNGFMAKSLGHGVAVFGDNNDINSNKIGTDVIGQNILGNRLDGVNVWGDDNLIGDDLLPAEGNIIGGNHGAGVRIVAGNDNLIKFNSIGTDLQGSNVPNKQGGVIDNGQGTKIGNNLLVFNEGSAITVAGMTTLIADNTIEFTTGIGLTLLGGTGHLLADNTIINNTGFDADFVAGEATLSGVHTINEIRQQGADLTISDELHGVNFTQTGGTTTAAVLYDGSFSGQVDIQGGVFNLNLSDISAAGGLTIADGATFDAVHGTITADVTNSGLFSMGEQTWSIVTIYGNFTQTATGELWMEIGNTSDFLNVVGTVNFGGTLTVTTETGFDPENGSFDLIGYVTRTGEFDTLDLPELSQNTWTAEYNDLEGMFSIWNSGGGGGPGGGVEDPGP